MGLLYPATGSGANNNWPGISISSIPELALAGSDLKSYRGTQRKVEEKQTGMPGFKMKGEEFCMTRQ